MAFTYEIVKKIATIAEAGGNNVELNIIRYGNKAPKYDLRRWRGAQNAERNHAECGRAAYAAQCA